MTRKPRVPVILFYRLRYAFFPCQNWASNPIEPINQAQKENELLLPWNIERSGRDFTECVFH